MSLRLRLTLWNIGILTLAFLVLGIILRARTEWRVRTDVDHSLLLQARQLPQIHRQTDPQAGESDPQGNNFGGPNDFEGRGRGGFGGPPPNGPNRPNRPDRPDRPNPSGFPPPLRPPLFRANGESRFGGKPAPYKPGILEAAATHQANWATTTITTTIGAEPELQRVYTFPFLSERSGEWEYFQAVAPLDAVKKEVDDVTRDLLKVLPFAVLLAGAGGLFLTNRVLRPIRLLTVATARIGASDLSQRLPVSEKEKNDEMGQLATTFNGMLERLEEAFERQRRFVADASHELRSPLTVIKTSAELGKTDPTASAEMKSLFARIDRAADRTNRLVQNLLLLARGDAQSLTPQFEPVLLITLFTEAVAEAKSRRPDSVPIIVEGMGDARLQGDAAMLHQVLVNLLDNALRHTPSGGSVKLRALESGFSVTDTGSGIPEEHLPHLGERFYRVDSARTRSEGGTGLGLSICYSIIKAHHGTMTFSTSTDSTTSTSTESGTCVEVHLPALPV